jgi:hypothetical protein
MNQAAKFFQVIDQVTRDEILTAIAAHYGVSSEEAFSEVTDSQAEPLLEYMVGPQRAATSALMQRHGFR